jgi:hypothetical protein
VTSSRRKEATLAREYCKDNIVASSQLPEMYCDLKKQILCHGIELLWHVQRDNANIALDRQGHCIGGACHREWWICESLLEGQKTRYEGCNGFEYEKVVYDIQSVASSSVWYSLPLSKAVGVGARIDTEVHEERDPSPCWGWVGVGTLTVLEFQNDATAGVAECYLGLIACVLINQIFMQHLEISSTDRKLHGYGLG